MLDIIVPAYFICAMIFQLWGMWLWKKKMGCCMCTTLFWVMSLIVGGLLWLPLIFLNGVRRIEENFQIKG